MAKPLIVCRDLSIIYNKGKSNEFKALQGVNTDIYEGEYIILFSVWFWKIDAHVFDPGLVAARRRDLADSR